MALSMSEDEICASFHNSKNPKKQVKILAQLNACGEDRIKAILEERNITPLQGPARTSKYEKVRWTSERKEALRRMLEAGSSRKEIADHFHCSNHAVTGVITRMGIKTGQVPRDTPWRKFRDNRKEAVSNEPRRTRPQSQSYYIGKENAG